MAVTNDDTGNQASPDPLNVSQGGTGADLSATGGTSRFVFQESVGADFTVRVAASGDLPTTLSSKTLTSPTLTSPIVSTGDLTLSTGGLVISGATKGVRAYGRTVQEGEQTTPAFSVGNFTAGGAMTWSVGSGDVTTYSYAVVGKTMFLSFYIVNTTVGGVVSDALKIAVPGGFTPSTTTLVPILYNDNGTGLAVGFAEISVGVTTISLKKLNVANWTLATDNTAVYGRLTFGVF